MQVKTVTSNDVSTTFCCMNTLPPDAPWAKGLPEARQWFKNNLGKHIEGYHLLDNNKVIGFIYWETSERMLLPYEVEPEIACIYCTEILPDYQHKGYGKIMFDHMKNDLRRQGFKGIMVPATDFKEWVHHELFQKQGFKTIQERPPYKIMYLPLTQNHVKIKFLNLTYKPSKDKVEITLFNNFSCPVGVHMHHLTKKVAQTFGDKVKIVEIEATPENIHKHGTTDNLINGKIKTYGPASEEDLKKAIQEEINHIKH